jgi:hypothetical protein
MNITTFSGLADPMRCRIIEALRKGEASGE